MEAKIIPSLWFDNNAKEAMNYYVSVFPNSKIKNIEYYPDEKLVDEEVASSGRAVQMFEIEIEHLSGKEVQER